MHRLTLLICYFGLLTGSTGSLYFLSLAAGLPFVLTVILCLGAGMLLYAGMHRLMRSVPPEHDVFTRREGAVLCGAILFLSAECLFLARKWGDWDAVYIWTLHARFLKSPERWTTLFGYTRFAHPDYPMNLPANVAFWWRLTGGAERQAVPFAFSFLTTLLAPVLLYVRLCRQHLGMALLALAIFATNTFYLNIGLIQCADVALAFFLLCALICLEEYRRRGTGAYAALCGALLGCCLWTKNEGIMLSLVFGLFYGRTLLSGKGWSFLAGIALPLLALLVFKTGYAPANDLVQGQRGHQLSQLLDKERYKLIFAAIGQKMEERFYVLQLALLGYAFYCAFTQRLPAKGLVFVLACMGGYFAVYLLTPHDLSWHLSTSLDRLMLHLMPVTVYLLGHEAVGIAKGKGY